jgi:hypothetical protein
MNQDTTSNEATSTPAAAPKADKPVGTAAKKAAKRPSKVKVTKPKAKAVKKARKVNLKGKKGPEVLREYVAAGKYAEHGKTASGNAAIDCGDKVAAMLRGKELADVYDIVSKRANLPLAGLKKRFAKLNVGMQRMNLGNVLRGAL